MARAYNDAEQHRPHSTLSTRASTKFSARPTSSTVSTPTPGLSTSSWGASGTVFPPVSPADVLRDTLERLHCIRQLVYYVVAICGCEWEQQKKNNDCVAEFVQDHDVVAPLDPSDAFYLLPSQRVISILQNGAPIHGLYKLVPVGKQRRHVPCWSPRERVQTHRLVWSDEMHHSPTVVVIPSSSTVPVWRQAVIPPLSDLRRTSCRPSVAQKMCRVQAHR